ncbi:hypothetical protein IFM89_030650 [Coptis chinensis]|uniref:Formin-like protein n=1 Tax=Coptis chinensis TaxID=261450 RepID=A0A835M1W6_9MAGN|nr:hypothetical protein IFM89_030650 [Coptis chinensis]
MALFRKFFYRKPPDGLLEISERVYVFDCCFSTDVLEEDDYKVYMGGIVGQLRDHFPDASFMVFNFREGERQSQISSILSDYDMTVMDYPRHYEGCPLLTMEMIHHFLRSSESWLSLGQQNVLLMHCERGGWPALAFMLASLLIYRKQYTGEQKTLDMIYKQAPRELLQLLSSMNPLPSQLRYLHYVSRRNVGSEWPPLDRALTLDCIILRILPNFDGEGGFRPIFHIYGQDPFIASDRTPKVLFSTPKKSKTVRHYKQADCELVKIDIHCHIQGDVVVECISLDEDREREVMMFRVMFNTAFIRSNILMLNRDEIDILWDAKDRFPKDFRAEVLFSDMDAADSLITMELPTGEEKEGLPVEAFAKVQEIFNNVDWLDPKADVALNVLQQINTSNILQEKLDPTSFVHNVETNILLKEVISDKLQETLKPAMESITKSSTTMAPDKESITQVKPSLESDLTKGKVQSQELQLALQRSTQSKIITQRMPQSSLSSPGSYSNSLQGSPLPMSRYHSAPSALGITALLHDHSYGSTEITDPVKASSPPLSTSSSSVSGLPTPVSTYIVPKSSPPPPPPPPPQPPCIPKAKVQSSLMSPTTTTAAVPLPPPFPQMLASVPARNQSSVPPPPPPPVPPVSGATIKSSPRTNQMSSFSPPPPPPAPLVSCTSTKTSQPPPPPPPSVPITSSAAPLPPRPPSAPLKTAAGPPPPPPPSYPGSSFGSALPTSAPPPPPPPSLASTHAKHPTSSQVPPVPPPTPFAKGAINTGGGSPKFTSAPPTPAPPILAKGRGLIRNASTKNQQSAQSKKSSLKPLHWLKLTRAMQGSLWAETQKSDETSKAPDFDMSELESLFSAAVPNSDRGNSGEKSSRRASVGGKSEKIQLIDLRRAKNCEIMLTKVKIPLPDLMSSVLALDDSALDIDQVDNLIKFSPTKEEMELLKGYSGNKENLGKCEQFFLELMKVPRSESKLRVFSFKIQFCSQVSELRSNLNIVNSASEEARIRNSAKLKRIMQTILSLGNALNQGTARGSAIGFRLDSLLKLTDTRARNNKMTLMHYLCKVLADKLPELLDFQKDLVSLEAATKIQLKYLAEEMQAISKGLEKVEQELTTSENDGPVSQMFRKTLKEFLAVAEGEVRSLASLYSGVGRNADALAHYFGEDPARCPFEQVVSTLRNFVRMFVRAHEENCKQLELEKKRAQKEAENEKTKNGTPPKESELTLTILQDSNKD